MSMPITMQLTAAHARVAKLEEQLATVTAERDALQAELAAARAKELSEEDAAGLQWALNIADVHANDTHGFDEEDLRGPCLAVTALAKLIGRKDKP